MAEACSRLTTRSPWAFSRMPMSLSLLVFLTASAILVGVFRRSLSRPRFHGFFRFFAFEAILGIIVLNVPVWFVRPFAPAQLLSWVLLLVSAGLAIHGYTMLTRLGRPSRPEPDSPMFRVESTTLLVTSGAYRYIRHPLYASLLCLAWGAALKQLGLASLVLAILATFFLLATAKCEEAENLARFGDAYRVYVARTKRFIPFVF